MLSAERKKQMVQSLIDDYVVLTDIVGEVIGETKTDIFYLMYRQGEKPEFIDDYYKLVDLDNEYDKYFRTEPEKAVDIIEQLYELGQKYDKLRLSV